MNAVLCFGLAGLAGLVAPASSGAAGARLGGPSMPVAGSRPPCLAAAHHVERTAYVMGTLLRVEVKGVSRTCALVAIEAALRETERLEAVLSSWRTDSEVGRVNRSPAGAAVAVSAELVGLLREAGDWVSATGGAFDPAVGALVDVWDLRGSGRVPSQVELMAARAATGWRHVRLADGTVTRLVSGVWLDTGGFGKGAALRAAAVVLRAHGVERGVLDFGGQLLVLGRRDSIAVAHPHARGVPAAWLRLADASVSTTSASERFVESAGVRLGHVVDPRYGRPVPAWGSVTVVAPDPLAADALSTALFVLGPEAALAWAEGREDIGVLVLVTDDEGRVVATWNAAMVRYLVAVPGTAPAPPSLQTFEPVTRS